MQDLRKRRAAAASRYEMLTTPQKWTGDEKRFSLRLTQLFDEVFERLSALAQRITALEESMQQEEHNG